MADSYVQVPVDGAGKKLRTAQRTVSANVVEEEYFHLVDENGNLIAFLNSAPGGTEYAIPVRNVGSQAVTGTFFQATQPVSAASLPLPTGAATEATLDARTGALTEAAPGTDTASSGLNGRLQRIAQRLTSLIALVPGSLGQKTMANGFAVTIASDQTVIPVSDNSGSLTVDGSVSLAAAIPAGTNNIGDIDVLTVPADPFGANADAIVAAGAVGSMQAKLRRVTQGLEDLKTLTVLAAGNNNIGDVDIASLPGAATATAPAQTAQGTTAAVILAANANRRRLIVQNTGTTIIKLALGGTNPTQTAYHVALSPCTAADDGLGGTYLDDAWTGAVRAISSVASGTLVVTELTA